MFKFMKSKKGFSLVELMIVVVIMAILVAVAVPIFNSVTGNARAKTCIDNQRTIISTINTALLENPVDAYEDFDIVTDENGDGSFDSEDANVFDEDLLGKLFQTVPYCPLKESTITVKITPPDANDANGITSIETSCTNNTGKDPHVLTKS